MTMPDIVILFYGHKKEYTMREITSDRNPLIKNYLKIAGGKFISEEGIKLPLEGFHLIEEAVNRGYFIEQFFFSLEIARPALLKKLLRKIPQATGKIAVSASVINRIAQTENPQGVAAVAHYPLYIAEEVFNRENLLAIVVDRLQDPGNFGTIIRTAAGAGFDAVFYTPGTVKITNSKVLRATAGALFHIKVLPTGPMSNFCNLITENDVSFIAADPKARLKYYDADFSKSSLIIIGNENKGVSSELTNMTTTGVSIPLKPGINSINASVAAGIIIYEARKQRLVTIQG